MTVAELLDEAMSHYVGTSQTNGTKDPVRLAELRAIWRDAAEAKGYRAEEARWVRNEFLSEEAIGRGYGAEDALGFLNWVYDRGMR